MNKFFKQFSRLICSIIVIAICVSLFGGCSFFSSQKLSTPSFVVNKDTKTLTFNADSIATGYEIYLNEKLVELIEEKGEKTQYSVDYSEYLPHNAKGEISAGEYRFQIKSIGNDQYSDSKMSTTKSVVYGDALDILNNNVSMFGDQQIEYIVDSKTAPQNVTISNKTISWDAPEIATGLVGYMVSIFSNTLGVKNVEVSDTQYTLGTGDIVSHDVVVVRVSAKYSDQYSTTDEYVCYNPMDADNRKAYTDTYYIFKGGVYDYFIVDLDELRNFYYYAFIYRLESVDFMVLNAFYSAYSDTYFDTMTGKCDDYILGFSYSETYGFSAMPSLNKLSSKTEDKVMRLTCGFSDKQASLTSGLSDKSLEQIEVTPYYESIIESSKYRKRDISTHSFESDTWLLSAKVESSEELFWAVANGVSPRFNSTTSRAYQIYNKAKEALCEIIYDGMTDYEKVLSIFDYIMNKSTYDWKTYSTGLSLSGQNPMSKACYYLEGFFLNPNRVVVCDSMSKTFTLLCSMEGINAVRVVGDAGVGEDKGGHAWNKVFVDGKWYVVDLTWTEASISNQYTYMYVGNGCAWSYGQPYAVQTHEDVETSCHHYFLVDDSYVEETHIPYENEILYKMMATDEMYNFYDQTYDGKHTRVISSDSDLTAVLEYMLIHDMGSMELMVDSEYFSSYHLDITTALKKCKKLFGSVSSFFYTGQTYDRSRIHYVSKGIEFESEEGDKITVYYELPESYFTFTRNSDGDQDFLMILNTRVSISSAERLNQYFQFVKNNNIPKNTEVSISKEFICSALQADGVSTTGKTNTQLVTLFEDYLNSKINTVGYSKSVTLTMTSGFVPEKSNIQQDNGTFKEMTLEMGEFTITFGAVK